MSDSNLRTAWLADEIRAQVACGLHYPADEADTRRLLALRDLAATLLATVEKRDEGTLRTSFSRDQGLRTPLVAIALGHGDTWRATYLRGDHLLGDVLDRLESHGTRINRERLRVVDSHNLSLAIPHTYILAYQADPSDTWPSMEVNERLSETLGEQIDSDRLNELGAQLPENVSLETATVLRQIHQLTATAARESTDRHNQHRFAYLRRATASYEVGAEPQARLDAGALNVATPTTGSEAALLRGDRILLMKRSDTGQWAIPGGASEVGESSAATAIREMREETGLDVTVDSLHSVLDNREVCQGPTAIHLIAIWLVTLKNQAQEPTRTAEATDFGWFNASQIDDVDMFDGHRFKAKAVLDGGQP
ncbi:NUDIX hydrolase [Natronoglycomyces albus]|uniref:NUDIX hydrolase N-terminal domain-containing protein n=1 Tax=Natronoglycomyces albus TaxID=2811108 RepID=A0A895XNP1_9ACTN|nr:NUDIX domain-containing protein [Natronoglycomyces albus]QSB06747.1 NUDIX hydrolase N-terminal domain-containing protein [Natronoglycomyces albus]